MPENCERHLWRWKPENRLKALRKYYDRLAGLNVHGQPSLALLLDKHEGIPYSAFSAQMAMIVVYGRSDDNGPVHGLGYVTLERLLSRPQGKVLRLRTLSQDGWTQLSAEQAGRLRELARGVVARPGARSRISPMAARTVLAGATAA
jgi:hypothetical protein